MNPSQDQDAVPADGDMKALEGGAPKRMPRPDSIVPPFLLEARDISKRFPGVQALDAVSLGVRGGEVLAVVGENGAGKSTLMKILAGVYSPDAGTVLVDGQAVQLGGVAEALSRGISLIHQELNVAENLSVAANLFLGREPVWGGWLRLLDRAGMARAARPLMRRLGLDCRPETPVGDLSPGHRQLVEIAHAMATQARVLIMDEPTSSLTSAEAERLFGVVADLKRTGVAIIYISHRLAEVGRVADRVAVLRDGRHVGELARDAISHDAMVRLMVGRDLRQFFQRGRAPTAGPPVLELQELRYAAGPATPISLAVRRGEILGLAGLVGAGRTELAEALFGIRRVVSGKVLLEGRRVRIRNPWQAVAAGVLLVPEDRRVHGLVLEDSVRHNIGLPNLDRLSFLRIVLRRSESALALETCRRLDVRTPDVEQEVSLLSGGNQQKVVLGKWLARRPRLLIFDEPTRGVDVGAKSELYSLMDQLAGQGVGILMISSDLEEILGMSDRVAVLHRGRLAGEVRRDKLTEETVMRLATGGRHEP